MKLMPFTLRFWLWSKCQQMMSFSSVYGFSAILSSMMRSEEHTSELQSRLQLVCRLLLEKKIREPAGPPLPGGGRPDLQPGQGVDREAEAQVHVRARRGRPHHRRPLLELPGRGRGGEPRP